MVRIPSGSFLTKLQACALTSASVQRRSTSASFDRSSLSWNGVPVRPTATLSKIVPENKDGSCETMLICERRKATLSDVRGWPLMKMLLELEVGSGRSY